MTDITPPPELVKQWWKEAQAADYMDLPCWVTFVATRAAQWGADQELEACREWFVRDWTDIETADKLRAARRPKSPSLKEQALEALEALQQRTTDPNIVEPLRRALEQLDD